MAPSPFVAEWAARLAPRTTNDERSAPRTTNGDRTPFALDLAMGRGRHALLLARTGFKTFGVDINPHAVRDAVQAARSHGLVVLGWCADLTRTALPRERFDLVVVTRYLQRDLFPSLSDAVTRGGVIVYETFTVAQRAHGRGPTSPDHLLEPGELRNRFDELDVLFYEEVSQPEAVARVVARRRSA